MFNFNNYTRERVVSLIFVFDALTEYICMALIKFEHIYTYMHSLFWFVAITPVTCSMF